AECRTSIPSATPGHELVAGGPADRIERPLHRSVVLRAQASPTRREKSRCERHCRQPARVHPRSDLSLSEAYCPPIRALARGPATAAELLASRPARVVKSTPMADPEAVAAIRAAVDAMLPPTDGRPGAVELGVERHVIEQAE